MIRIFSRGFQSTSECMTNSSPNIWMIEIGIFFNNTAPDSGRHLRSLRDGKKKKHPRREVADSLLEILVVRTADSSVKERKGV